MNITLNRLSTCLLLFLSVACVTISAAEAEVTRGSAMLTPVIITLAIPDEKKNDPELIASFQDQILAQLKDSQVENITRYRYLPQLALSVDEAGLSKLKLLKEVKLISGDGLSSPQLTPQKTETNNTKSTVTPCHNTKSNK